MGGIKKAFEKIGIGGGSQAAIEHVSSRSQATQQEVFEEESGDRAAKGAIRKGKKKLQIPTQNTSTTTASTGTGLGTGV